MSNTDDDKKGPGTDSGKGWPPSKPGGDRDQSGGEHKSDVVDRAKPAERPADNDSTPGND